MSTLTFIGATGQVTGSNYLLETSSYRILLDCGLFQGRKEVEAQNAKDFPYDPATIDAVVLSHAHIDHCGRLPKLTKDGFTGPVFLTKASFDLLDLMLNDTAHLMLRDTEWENKRRKRAGKRLIEPLYTVEDVENVLQIRQAVSYHQETEILPGIKLTFHEAGHILGSSIVELKITDQGETKTLVFSGDLGNPHSPLLRDPNILTKADVLLLESTYGDRDHQPLINTLDELRDALASAAQSGGNVIIPAFAVGRTQDLIYWLGKLHREGALPQKNVYLDSPMAIRASEIYAAHPNLFNIDDPEFNKIAPKGWQAWLPSLSYSESAEQSMELNKIEGGAIFIAGSGMCTGGRIRHHLKYNLWRHNAHVIFVGFQAEGTLGRMIIDGKHRSLKILGSEVKIAAHIHTLGALSAHADQTQLLQWAGNFKPPLPALYLIHGEPEASRSLQTSFRRNGWAAKLPSVGEKITI